jgi:4'-phosphopantetheinyl transferase EntD
MLTTIKALVKHWLPDAAIHVCRIENYPLFEEEAKLVKKAVLRRKEEFASGRFCARKALSILGFKAQVIGVGNLRQPLWPRGIIGSISHDSQIAVAICLQRGEIQDVGIDIHHIITDIEYDHIEDVFLSLEEKNVIKWNGDKHKRPLFFAAKEATVKALSSQAQRMISLKEIIITPAEGGYSACLYPENINAHGFWAISQGLAIALTIVTSK